MRHFRITFFRCKTSFLERDMNEKFWKKCQMFFYVASINSTNFKVFHWFFNEWENNNEIAGIPDFKLEYLAHTNWSKKSASRFLFCEPITTRIGWSRFCDRPLFFCNTVLGEQLFLLLPSRVVSLVREQGTWDKFWKWWVQLEQIENNLFTPVWDSLDRWGGCHFDSPSKFVMIVVEQGKGYIILKVVVTIRTNWEQLFDCDVELPPPLGGGW